MVNAKAFVSVASILCALASAAQLGAHTVTPLPDTGEINPLDRALMAPYDPVPSAVSDILRTTLEFGPLAAAAVSGSEGDSRALQYLNAVFFTDAVVGTIKARVHRHRPYFYFMGHALNGHVAESFPSGHTATAFTGAAFTAFLLSGNDSPWKTATVGAAFAAACGTGILRVVSGNHFASDVVAGAAIGGVSGALLPYLTSRLARRSLEVRILPGAVMFTKQL
jgi:undecaprenyl-diphosphatase